MKQALSQMIPISDVFTSTNARLSQRKVERDEKAFYRRCVKVARDFPELSAEEVEYRAVLTEMGLFP